MPPRPRDPTHRFWAKINTTDPGGCWLWAGSIRRNGYGRFAAAHGHVVLAHRWAYEHVIGPIPAGLGLDHLCHNADRSCAGGPGCRHRRCVRPDHLEPVATVVNLRRGRLTGAPRQAYCARGHKRSSANVISSNRACRTCVNLRRRQLRAAKRKAAA
jgi:hypothetical protein